MNLFKHPFFARSFAVTALGALALIFSLPVSAQSPPNIRVRNYLSAEKVAPGRTIQGIVEMEIPHGYHVNSARPLEKFLIPTQLTVEPSGGLRVGPVSYPRAVLRNLKFSKSKVSVYEGKAVMRFNITAPANFSGDGAEIKAKLRYQSCSDEVCFPPKTHEMKFWVKVSR